jgi:diguanylate cyclase (GGDEF)-like protein/PAS domain S-box-containing protein
LAGAIVNACPDGILLVDGAGRILLANPAMCSISGYPAEQLAGKPVELFLPAELAEAHVANRSSWAERQGQRPMGRIGDLSLRRRDGISVAVDISLSICQVQGHMATVVFVRDVSEVRRLQESLRYQATHDIVTRLPNRWQFEGFLAQTLAHARRHGREFALIMIDLDEFKAINDTYGHGAGDMALAEAARRLGLVLRTGDSLARLGGDEFAVLLSDIDGMTAVGTVSAKLTAALLPAFEHHGNPIHLACSVGIACFPVDGTDAEALMRCADAAMYRAKARRKEEDAGSSGAPSRLAAP